MEEKEKLISERLVSVVGSYLQSDQHTITVLDYMTQVTLIIEEGVAHGNRPQL